MQHLADKGTSDRHGTIRVLRAAASAGEIDPSVLSSYNFRIDDLRCVDHAARPADRLTPFASHRTSSAVSVCN